LWGLVEADMAQAGLEPALPLLRACRGGGILLVLDGLDELQDLVLERALAAIEDLVAAEPHDAVWVLSRTEPITRGGPGLADFQHVTLAALDEWWEVNPYLRFVEGSQIERFVRAWFEAAAAVRLMPATAAEKTTASLLAAVQDPALRAMAGNPLLLAKMVLFQATRDPLPENRAVFCHEVVDLLLHRWPQGRLGNEVPSRAPVSPQQLEGALGWIAAVIRRQGSVVEGRAVVEKAVLVEAIAPLLFGKAGVAEAALAALVRRGGLLAEGPPELYGFVYPALLEVQPQLRGAPG
jgi:hypothetical protein